MATGTATEQLDRIEEQLKTLNATFGDYYTDSIGILSTIAQNVQDADQNNQNALSFVQGELQTMIPLLTKVANGVWDTQGNIAYADRVAQRVLTISNLLATWTGRLDAQTSWLFDIYTRLDGIGSGIQFINSTLGAGDGVGNDMISYIRELRDEAVDGGCGCTGINTDPERCPERLTSNGMLLIPFDLIAGVNVHLATFPPNLPPDVEFGEIVGIRPFNSDLVNTSPQGWAAWSIYVASNSETFSADPAGFKRYPTNKWMSMFGFPQTVAFTVEGSYGLTVHLCPPGDIPPEPLPGAGGWFGGRQTISSNSREDKLFFMGGSSFSNLASLQTLDPAPLPDHVGRPLFFTHCAYTGNGPDKKIYVSATSGNPKGDAFLVLNPGDKNVPWIVREDVEAFLFTASWEGWVPGSMQYAAAMVSWEPFDDPCAEIWDDIP